MVTIKFIFLKMNKKKKIPLSNSIDRLAKRGSCIPLHLQGRTFEPLYSHPLFGYRRQWVHMSVNVLEKKKGWARNRALHVP